MSTPQSRLVASVPGRLRIRQQAPALPQLHQWQAQIAAWPEVEDTRLNAQAGSLVVQYRITQCGQHEMESRVLSLCNGQPAQAAPSPQAITEPSPVGKPQRARRAAWRRRTNRGAKVAAMVALPVSIALVYAGNKRLHAATGWLFVAALSVHLAIHRRNVFH